MTAGELAAIRRIIREELAAALHSRGTSLPGIGTRGQGDLVCEETEQRKHMDLIDTHDDGESSSLRQLARDELSRLRASDSPAPSSRSSKTKRRGAR